MAEFFGTTVEDIFNSMPARFKSDETAGMDITIGYKCGEEGQWKVKVKDKKLTVEKIKGKLSGCDVIIEAADAQTFIGTTIGKINGMDAMTSGKLKIEGDAKLITSALPKILSPYSVAGADQQQELLSINVVNSIDQRFASGPVMGMWYAGLKQKKLLANKCPKCGRTQIPPREVCAVCRIRVSDYVEVGPKGTVTDIERVFYAAPDPMTGYVRKTPYVILFVVLDGATEEESMTHEFISKQDYDKIKPGSRVRAVWAEKTTGSYNDMLGFELDK